LGCLDATVAGICLINPTQTELAHIKQAIVGTMNLWCKLKILNTTKAHILESHVYSQIVFHGLGDKAKDFIEQGHQEGVADGHHMKFVQNCPENQSSARKTSQLINHPNVLAKKEDVAQKAKRKVSSSKAIAHEARVSLETIVKSEKCSKFVNGEQ
jgi:hypothetical protein